MRQVDTEKPSRAARGDSRGTRWQGRALLAVFALALALGAMIDRPLSRRDEPRVAGIARAMILEGDFVTPRLNGELFLEYPPLGYLPMALAFGILGDATPFAAHLASTLAGLATVLLTCLLGRRAGGERVGLVAGFVLASTLGFVHLNERAMVDPWLLFWITLALTGFQAGFQARRRAFLGFSVFYLALAGAVLTKGLIGLGLPAATVGVFVLVRRDWSLIAKLRPWWGALVFAAPLLLWGGLLCRAEGVGAAAEVLRQSVSRFFSGSADHAQPSWFYIPVVFAMLAPFSLFVPLVLWRHLAPRRLRRVVSEGAAPLLFRTWFVVVVMALSIASAKRNVYLAPIYPAFAVLFALWWEGAAHRRDAPGLDRRVVAALPWIGLLAALAASGLAWGRGGLATAAVFGLVAAIVFAVFLSGRPRRLARPGPGLACFLIGLLPLVVALRVHVELPRVRDRDPSILFHAVAELRETRSLLLYRPKEWVRGAAVFYLGERVPEVTDLGELRRRLADDPRTLVIAMTAARDEVAESATDRVEVLAETRERRSRRFELLRIAGPDDPPTLARLRGTTRAEASPHQDRGLRSGTVR